MAKLEKIVFVYPPGRLSRLPDARSGRAPTELFFGGVEAEFWAAVTHVEVDLRRRRVAGRLPDAALAAFRLLRRHGDLDCIVVCQERLSFALAFWKIVLR